MVRLRLVGEYEKRKLWKLLQAYLGELAPYYGETPGPQGQYAYPYFGSYFVEDPARYALFIEDQETGGRETLPAGFLLVNDHSATAEPVDYAVAEFYVRPELRRRGFGKEAVGILWDGLPGRWQIKYACANSAGGAFWESVARDFSPSVVEVGNGLERALTFTVARRG